MTSPSSTASEWLAATRRFFVRPKVWFIVLMALWWVLLALFYLAPQIDLAVARAFFTQAACGEAIERAASAAVSPMVRKPCSS